MHLLILVLVCVSVAVDCSESFSKPGAKHAFTQEQYIGKTRFGQRSVDKHSLVPNVNENPWHNEYTDSSEADESSSYQRLKNHMQAFQEKYDEEIQVLKETVKELTDLVKRQSVYLESTKKLERKISDQENIISKLKEEVEQLKNGPTVTSDNTVLPEDVKNYVIINSEVDPQNQTRTKQQIFRNTAPSAQPRGIQHKKRLLVPTTLQPVTTPNIKAFYAYMSTYTPSIAIQHSLVFDVVKTNIGNGYHPSTGVFIVPETGVYVFTWTIREYGDCHHATQLMVNNEEVGIFYVHAGSGGDVSGTGVVVTHVNTGDDVYVRTYASLNNCDIKSDWAGKSSFAGWKLA